MAKFSIDVRFKGGLTKNQQAAFTAAAARWKQVIVNDFPKVKVNGETIHALVIEASGRNIDGVGNILGQSAPQYLLPNGLPAWGMMEFDTADLHDMEAEGSLHSVILHEMGHVLGIGSIWTLKHLLVGKGHANPRFVGAAADAEWHTLSNLAGNKLPVENHGGPGTEDSHWRETVFGDELMTGYLSGSTQPLSRMTIASLQDLGYTVDLTKADPYVLPSHLEIRTMGVGASPERVRRCSQANPNRRPHVPFQLPAEALDFSKPSQKKKTTGRKAA